jgi:epoxyqueuosine reductase
MHMIETKIKQHALELHFDACGIAKADQADPNHNLEVWLDKGYHGSMDWIKTTQAIREDVSLKVAGAQSVIVVTKNYYHPLPETESIGTGRIARYAWGRDYHKVMIKPLRKLADFLAAIDASTQSYCTVDSGPVLERSWAERAGIGAIGKNSLVLRQDVGSWFFLGVIVTTMKLKPDSPAGDICGTCTACLDACPTRAIVEPGVVDSNKCISYQTIENRGAIPEPIQSTMGNWVFGCDICQEVCPWNRFATPTDEPDFAPRSHMVHPELDTLVAMDEETYNKTYEGTPVRRTRFSGFNRNSKIARENVTTVKGNGFNE